MLQKNIQSYKRYFFIQTLQLLFPMLGRMKTEYFGWSGNTNQFQEINMRPGCLPPLGFSSLAFHINPLQTLRSCAGLLTGHKLWRKGCLWGSLWLLGRLVWVWGSGHMGWMFDLSRTWKRKSSRDRWATVFLRRWLFTDLYSVMGNALDLNEKKSEMRNDQNSRSSNDIIKPLQKLADLGKPN